MFAYLMLKPKHWKLLMITPFNLFASAVATVLEVPAVFQKILYLAPAEDAKASKVIVAAPPKESIQSNTPK